MAKTQSSAPPFINFLKEGVLLPARNRRLFVAVFLLVVASTTSLHFLAKNVLPIQPVVTDNNKLNLDARTLNGTDDPTTRSSKFLGDTSWNLMPVIRVAGYHLITVIGDSIIRTIVLFAAVTTYSGELHTFTELLRKARTLLKGPLLMRAFLYALGIVAYVGVLAAMVAVLPALMFALLSFLTLGHYTTVIYVASIALFAAFFFLHYCFSFLCWFSVVVAVAEPAGGRHGAHAAFGRVWHLLKGKKMRALLFIFVTAVLPTVVSLAVHMLAAKMSDNTASGLLRLDAILAAAMEVYTVCAMTVFYYECTGSTEASAATGYICHGV